MTYDYHLTFDLPQLFAWLPKSTTQKINACKYEEEKYVHVNFFMFFMYSRSH